MSVLDVVFQTAFHGGRFTPAVDVSEHYQHWISQKDWRRCLACKAMHGKIWRLEETPIPEPPLHPSCRCVVEPMESIRAGTATMNGTEGADWALKYEGNLPDYYITKDDIKALGWEPCNAPSEFISNKMIAGGVYHNRNGHLPQKSGRTWYEADIHYKRGERNSQRIVWSDDGLLFVTYDHYEMFQEII